MGQIKLIDSSKFVDRVLGKVGTLERDAIERQIKEEKESYMMRECRKKESCEFHIITPNVVVL